MEPFKRIVALARAIGVPSRLALLQVVGEQGLSLTSAAATVGIAPSTAHRHLDQLVRVGLVTKTVKGRTSIYR
ncbi:MAG: ArsR/SmtB family transcription factor, partial [Polyangiaceae bacterium]